MVNIKKKKLTLNHIIFKLHKMKEKILTEAREGKNKNGLLTEGQGEELHETFFQRPRK